MPEFKDKTLRCLQCNKEFIWTAGEQRFYAEKGLKNEPKTCPTCRKGRNKEETIEVTCQVCGAKGHIQTSGDEKEDLVNRSVICQKCLDAASSSNT